MNVICAGQRPPGIHSERLFKGFAFMRQISDVSVIEADDDRSAKTLGFLGFWAWDMRTGLVEASPGIDRFFGLCLDRPGAYPVEDYDVRIHPDDLEWLREERPRCFGPSGHGVVEYRVIDDAGQVRWVMCRGFYETDDGDTVVRCRGLMIDVTAFKRDGNTLRTAPTILAQPLQVLVAHVLEAHRAACQIGDSVLKKQVEALLLSAGKLLARDLVGPSRILLN